jgi:hypothetical protein
MIQPKPQPVPEPREDPPVADRGQSYERAGAGDISDENFGAGGEYRGGRDFGGFTDQDYGSQGYSGQGYGDRSYGDPDYGGQTFARRASLEPALDSDPLTDVVDLIGEGTPRVDVDDAVEGIADDADVPAEDDTRRPDGEDEEYSDSEERT